MPVSLGATQFKFARVSDDIIRDIHTADQENLSGLPAFPPSEDALSPTSRIFSSDCPLDANLKLILTVSLSRFVLFPQTCAGLRDCVIVQGTIYSGL